jgi:hypothetical protein
MKLKSELQTKALQKCNFAVNEYCQFISVKTKQTTEC